MLTTSAGIFMKAVLRIRNLITIISLTLFSLNTYADTVEIPNLGLSIAAPPGFEFATDFDGLANLQTKDSVLMAILPDGAPPNFVDSFTKELLKTRGIEEQSREVISLDGTEATLIKAQQVAADTVFGKRLLLFYRDQRAYVVNVTYRDLEGDVAEQLETSLRSIQFIDAANISLDASPRLPLNEIQGQLLVGSTKYTEVVKMLGRKAESSKYFQEGLVRQQWRNAVDMELTIWFKNDMTISSSLEKDRNLSILGCYESGLQENGKEVIVHITEQGDAVLQERVTTKVDNTNSTSTTRKIGSFASDEFKLVIELSDEDHLLNRIDSSSLKFGEMRLNKTDPTACASSKPLFDF